MGRKNAQKKKFGRCLASVDRGTRSCLSIDLESAELLVLPRTLQLNLMREPNEI